MHDISFRDLAPILGCEPTQPCQGTSTHITTDSRQVGEAATALFVALKGPMRDGHDFIQDAFDKGVRQFIVEKTPPSFPNAGFYQVESGVSAIQQLAIKVRGPFDYPVVAITGSNGKTIVKEWLASIVSDSYDIVKSPKSYNSQIGVPLSVLEMDDRHNLGIFEAGISKSGEMSKLERILKPTLGIFTNIGEAHAEGFTSKKEKVDEKALLFTNSHRVLCRHEHVQVLESLRALQKPEVFSWSTECQEASLFFQVKESTATFRFEGASHQLDLPFESEPFLENLLHAVSAALLLNIPVEKIQKAIGLLPTIDMRLSLKKGRNGCYLIDDSYNNDLIGLRVALETQEAQKTDNLRKTLILSDMLESGIAKSALYEKIAQLIRSQGIVKLIGIGFDRSAMPLEILPVESSFFQTVQEFLGSSPAFREELILIKGARPYGFEKIVQQLQHQSHRTQLTVSFEKLRNNLAIFKKRLNPKTKVMAMVKAFAYGGGAYEIANFLQYQGIDYLGVAYLHEGRALREQGIQTPIMVMNPDVNSLGECEQHRLEPVVYNERILHNLLKLPRVPSFHLELETGMNRLGFSDSELHSLMEKVGQLPQNVVKGIFTHLAASDDTQEKVYTAEQLERFDLLYDSIARQLGYRPIKHALNTAGIVTQPDHQYDMVRLGIGLYGVDPSNTLPLETVATFSTFISQIKRLKSGQSVGYGRQGRVTRDSLVATIPVGYADGYLRAFGNGCGQVLVGDKLAPTIGNICMDMTMIDATECDAEEGQEIILMGPRPHLVELAAWAGTIPYEILTNIGDRVERVYSWL